MGQQIGSQLSQILDVGIYEFPKKAKFVKSKFFLTSSTLSELDYTLAVKLMA